MTIRRVHLWVMGLAAALLSHATSAQDAASTGTPAPIGEVKIEARQFGVGSHARYGELFGVQLVLTDSADKPRKVAVSLALPDDDGDTVLASRSVTLNPRLPMDVWLYGRLPAKAAAQNPFQVSVREADGGDDLLAQALGGRQIAAARARILSGVEADEGMFGVIGRRDLGLDEYELRSSMGGTLPIGHEATRVVRGIEPAMLPDDWRGLAMFSAIVWTEGDPLRLDGNRPQALREWINRGGHFVVVLPAVGNAWWDDANPLRDLMPDVLVERMEDVSLKDYRNLLTTPDVETAVFPTKSTIVTTFTPNPDADPASAMSIIDGPHGTVVTRRLVGGGMVTVIGLNLADDQLSRAQLISVASFWHRVLGGRFTNPPEDADSGATNLSNNMGGVHYPDDQIGLAISKSAAAGVGVLLALIVFGVYWLVAGPLGWGILRARSATRHAWVIFALTTGFFTAVAWAGATWIKPKNVKAYHFTILDHVYAQPVQRVRTWAGILLPGYGETTLRVGEADAEASWRHPITTWSAPSSESVAQSFPDARAYAVDVQRPESITLPMRSTIKETQIDFVGGPRWKGLRPTAVGQEPVLVRRGPLLELSGTLTHEYPGVLTEVWMIVVSGQIDEMSWQEEWAKKNYTPLLANAYGWKLSGSWAPGDTRSLAQPLNDTNRLDPRLRDLVPTSNFGAAMLSGSGPDAGQAPTDFLRLTFGDVLTPPNAEESKTNFGTSRLFVRRRATHGFDLSRWFTQPCLIVLGVVDNAPTPIPLFAADAGDLQSIESEGRTLVRWVYPLRPNPPLFTGRMLEKPKAADKKAATKPADDNDETNAPGKPTGGP